MNDLFRGVGIMQPITQEFKDLIPKKIKSGDLARPRCKVEVDRLTFIPGRIETLDFTTYDPNAFKEIRKVSVQPNEGGDYDGITNLPSADIVFPIAGHSHATATVTSAYGVSRGGSRKHTGVDYVIGEGTFKAPLVAAWSGKVSNVVQSNSTTGYGNYVDIIHDNGYKTRYAHLDSVKVSKGQNVKAGDLIGTIGNTGNVLSGGKVVSLEQRKTGAGAHLHFEIHKKVKGNYETVDPVPYLEGKSKAYGSIINTGGGVVDEGITAGYQDELILYESFARNDWHTLDRYSVEPNFNELVTYETLPTRERGKWATFVFDKRHAYKRITTGFNIKLNMPKSGYMDIAIRSNFKYEEGDRFRVFVGDGNDASVNVGTFEGIDNIQVIKDVYVPKGDNVNIKIDIVFGGNVDDIPSQYAPKFRTKKLAIGYIEVQTLNPINTFQKKTSRDLDPTQQSGGGESDVNYFEELGIEEFLLSEKTTKMELMVGDFVYSDTRDLDNVISIEVNQSLDQECSGASVTITNEYGYYSPDYNPFYFPELNMRSPFSYWAGDYLIGILSTNTPIRIYLGYGHHLLRVFTGLIDKTDVSGESKTLTITARDMYKKVVDKVLEVDKSYPEVSLGDDFENINLEGIEKVAWLKSAVVHDLVAHAGLFGWRVTEEDLRYPDAVIEESYLIQVNQKTGTVVKAVPGEEGKFDNVPIESYPTPQGWKNPYTEAYGRHFKQYTMRVGECINEVLKDTHYRAYCDRYGTFRLEPIEFNKPVVDKFTHRENLMTISKSIDFSRARSHIIIQDLEGNVMSFVDKEILMELKGEIRTAVLELPWADTSVEGKRQVAERLFLDMKRVARSLTVAIPGNPALDLLDRVEIEDRNTATFSIYTIKGIRDLYDSNSGYTQMIDLFWAGEGVVV